MSLTHVMPTYARADLSFVRGQGAYLFTDKGERYLDFAAGIAVNALGHCHPHLVKALQSQAAQLWHTSNLYRIPEGERLADRLCDLTFADQVFFCNSGVEAVEGALKMARRFHHDAGHPEKTRVIAFDGAFHGRTLTTLTAAGNKKYLQGFGDTPRDFDHVAFGNLNEVRNAITPETAAILVEPVQGEGGVRAGDPAFLKGLRAVCDEFGLLLVLDEVQCGVARTGKLFAHEWAGIEPDIMAVAKGLGGGFPVGAILAKGEAAKVMQPGTHGSTFGGNPLAMAVANAVLDIVSPPAFLSAVKVRSKSLRKGITALMKKYPKTYLELRGEGLLIGLKCGPDVGKIVAALRAQKMLTVPAGENVLRILPPLIIGEEEIAQALAALDKAAQEVEATA